MDDYTGFYVNNSGDGAGGWDGGGPLYHSGDGLGDGYAGLLGSGRDWAFNGAGYSDPVTEFREDI